MTPRRPLTRRRFLGSAAVAAAGGGVGWLSLAGRADDAGNGPEFITPEAQAAVDRGLAHLSRVQANDGSFSDRQPNVAVTGLAGLALMAGGHQPGRGPHGRAVSKAVDYLLERSRNHPPDTRPGYLCGPDAGTSHSGMYQHGFGTLFLAEVSGMMPTADRQGQVRDALERAVAMTLASQNPEGGWRYSTRPADADVSVTVAQLMALRAARNAGVFVAKGKVDKCVEYIKACQQPDGGFCYIKGQGAVSGSGFARSAAAVVGLYSAGIYDGPNIEAGLKYLMQHVPGRQRGGGRGFLDPRGETHYFYGHYYAALAMWTAGGNYWSEWFPAVRDDLLNKVRGGAGAWADPNYGSAYSTAMACIILQLPNNYLPILQK